MNVPPYAASFGWYMCWFRCRVSGMSDDEAISEANKLCGIKGKDFARTYVGSPDTPMLLSVAVEGGASRLKRKGSERWVRLSMHGNWPHAHLGAFEALYGRSPYYQHILPGLVKILGEIPENLGALNLGIHGWLTSFMQTESFKPEEGYKTVFPAAVLARGSEIVAAIDYNMSVIDALMRFGPEINLGFIRYNVEISG